MYTYAFLNSSIPSLGLPLGIAGSLQVVGNSKILALVEPELSWETLQENEPQLMQAVLNHDRVLCQVFEQTTLLPLRFGTQFPSSELLINHLDRNQEIYLEKLARLEGKAEFMLKWFAIDSSPQVESEVSGELRGKAYFLAKKQRYQVQVSYQQQLASEREQILQAIVQKYPDVVIGKIHETLSNVHVLINRTDQLLLAQQIQTWKSQYSCWELSLSDPLPPYHFV